MSFAFRFLLAGGVLLTAGLACKDGTGPGTPSGVSVTPAVNAVRVGETVQLSATLVDAGGGALSTQNVTWTSSDSRVAQVSTDGLVSGLAVGGPVTITAVMGTQSGRADVTVTAGPASQVTIEIQPGAAGQSGVALPQQPVVQLRDVDGNAAREAGVLVSGVLAQGTGTLASETAMTDVQGRAVFSGLAISGTTGTYRIRFESTGLSNATSDEVMLGAGPPASAAMAVEPSAVAQSGVAFSTQPQILVLDAVGNPVGGASVSAAMASGLGTLGGTTNVTTDGSGIAAFTDLRVSGPVGNLTLDFTAGSATQTSGTIALEAGPPSGLTVPTQPSPAAQSGVVFGQQPVVEVRDGEGNPVVGIDVDASIASGGGTLGGAVTVVTDGNGRASFSNLSIVGAAGLRTLRFQAAAASVVSQAIDLMPGVPALATLSTQPSSSVQSGVPFGQQPVVSVTDSGGNPVPGFDVTATIASGGGSLGGTATVTTDAGGLATFSGLFISGLVGTRTVRFTAGPVQTVSNSIEVQAGPLATLLITQQPSSSVANGSVFPQQPVVTAADAEGNAIAGLAVTAEIASGGVAIGGTTTVNTSGSGATTFSDLRITGVVGLRTLRFSASGMQVVSGSINVVAGAASSVAILTQPPAINISGLVLTRSPVVRVQDVSGNPVPGADVVATLASGGGSLNGTTTVATGGGGTATFSTLAIAGSAGERTLRFTSNGVPAVSGPVHVSLAAGTYLDLQYCGSDPLQRLDVYVPSNSFQRPLPVVAYIHGGSWTGHDKSEEDLVLWANVRAELLSRGYVVTTLNYRLATAAPSTKWPAAIHDVKCAVRHLRADGADYGADGDRVGVWGASVGGHLAAMLGVTDGVSPTVHDFEGTLGYTGVSSAVQAAITIGGISDMTSTQAPAHAELNFVGGSAAFTSWPGPSTELNEASPIWWASGGDPPFLIIHGQEDATVDPAQGSRLYDALAGANPLIELVANAGHDLQDVGGAANPSIAQLVLDVSEFFDSHIKNGP